MEGHALLHQFKRQRRLRPTDAGEDRVERLRRAVAMKFDAVKTIAEVEEMTVKLPAIAVEVAGDDEETVRFDVDARQFGEGVVSLLKRDGQEGIERLGMEGGKSDLAQRDGCAGDGLRRQCEDIGVELQQHRRQRQASRGVHPFGLPKPRH